MPEWRRWLPGSRATKWSLLQSRLLGSFDKRCDVTGWTLHDLRRTRAFTEKTESWDSPAGTNRIQGSYWNGGQHGWRNRIRRICVGALLVRGKMALPSRKLRSNLE